MTSQIPKVFIFSLPAFCQLFTNLPVTQSLFVLVFCFASYHTKTQQSSPPELYCGCLTPTTIWRGDARASISAVLIVDCAHFCSAPGQSALL